jgi:hypothetical protein
MQLTNKFDYPEAFVRRVTQSLHKPKEDRIGVTALIDAPLVRKLMIEHWDTIVLDVDDFFKQSRGIAFHEYLQAGLPDDIEGEQLEVIEYNPLNIAFKMDIWNPTLGIIADYKTCSPYAIIFGEEKKWEQQLNIYSWAKRKQGFKVNKLIVHVFLWDWKDSDAEHDKDYPQRQFYKKELPLWTFEQQEKFVTARLDYHKEAKECTAVEKWQQNKLTIDGQSVIVSGPVYAVMQKNKKGALRLLPSHNKALEYIDEKKYETAFKSGLVYIEQRNGNCRRCTKYCNVRFVCPYSGLSQ